MRHTPPGLGHRQVRQSPGRPSVVLECWNTKQQDTARCGCGGARHVGATVLQSRGVTGARRQTPRYPEARCQRRTLRGARHASAAHSRPTSPSAPAASRRPHRSQRLARCLRSLAQCSNAAARINARSSTRTMRTLYVPVASAAGRPVSRRVRRSQWDPGRVCAFGSEFDRGLGRFPCRSMAAYVGTPPRSPYTRAGRAPRLARPARPALLRAACSGGGGHVGACRDCWGARYGRCQEGGCSDCSYYSWPFPDLGGACVTLARAGRALPRNPGEHNTERPDQCAGRRAGTWCGAYSS